MSPGEDNGESATPVSDPIQRERLTESYRFDDELATLLTDFQYREDGITLTSNVDRPVPAVTTDDTTPGLDAVFDTGASLVFVTYNERGQRMVNSVERPLIAALAAVVDGGLASNAPQADGGIVGPLGEQPATSDRSQTDGRTTGDTTETPSLGVVTPHNAQRGALDTILPASVTANTVEKYQGDERDIIAVSATVSDPEFARREDEFILNANRLLVAISRSRLLTIVICSTALFEVAPADSERLDDGPVWARLFTQAVGRDADPAWAGPLGEFVDDESTDHAGVPVQVYPNDIHVDGGDR